MERRPQRRVRNSNRYSDIDRRNETSLGSDFDLQSEASFGSDLDLQGETSFGSEEVRDSFAIDPASQKIQQIYLDEDGRRVPQDQTARLSGIDSDFQTQRIDSEPFAMISDDDQFDTTSDARRLDRYDDDLFPEEEMSYHEERMARKALAEKEGRSRTSSRQKSSRQSSRSQASRSQTSSRSERASRSQASSGSERASRSQASSRSEQASRQRSARQESARKQASREQTSRQSSRGQTSRQQDSRQQASRAQASRQSSREQTSRQQSSRQQASIKQASRQQASRQQANNTQARSRQKDASRQAQRERQQLKKQQTQRLDPVAVRKEAAKRRRRSKLPLIIFVAAIIVAIVVVVLIVSSGIKEAANVKITSTETTQTITWEKKEKNATYEVLQKTPEGNYTVAKTITADGEPTATIVELNSATEYEYKIRTVKGEGDKARHSNGVSARAYTLPSGVTDLSYWTEVKDSLTFSWFDAQNVTGYELRFGTSDNLNDSDPIRLPVSNLSVDEGTGRYTYLIENLDERTTYFYSLRSYINDENYSTWTEIRSAHVSRPVDMHGIDVNAPMVALTFDDGPEGSDITTRILDTFATYGGHATFFQLGDRASSYPDRIQRMVNEGHEVGNHTYDHSHLGDAVTREDIVNANDAIEAAGGVRPVSFRSPGGNTTDFIRQICIEENMSLYYWSLDTRDWYTRDAGSVISVIQNNISDGDIVLMHNIYGSTAEAVEQIVPWLQEQGYQLVTVSQLLKAKTGELPEPGVQYSTATKTMN